MAKPKKGKAAPKLEDVVVGPDGSGFGLLASTVGINTVARGDVACVVCGNPVAPGAVCPVDGWKDGTP
jgi:hypothetical protein